MAERGRRRVGDALVGKPLVHAGPGDSIEGAPLIALAPDGRRTLDAVERISLAARGGVTATVLLEDVCGAVADAFVLDSVAAVRYDAEADGVSKVAFAGAVPADRDDRRPIASVPLLEEARESQNLVVTVGNVTSTFALPLVSEDRCLAFLYGTRAAGGTLTETDREALATVGVVAATLLEGALAREEMQELNVLRSEFIALAAHELRNPLSSIYGISVTLSEREHELGVPTRVALRNALRDQASRVQNLVEQLLDLSRLDLEAVRICPEPVRLRPKVEEIVRPLADGRTNAVRIAVPPDLEVVVDPAALDLMLSNLVANSLRHGKPPVTIRAARQDRHLRLAVEDRGGGVPHEFVPRLFDRFARSSESAGRGGSGLGLAIAQAYARAHGGEIVYGPAVPRGARFEVVIPLRGYGDEQRLHKTRPRY